MIKIKMNKAGNGDCVSIETESEYILIDGGTAQSFDDWSAEIIDRVDEINAVFVTHIDNDHVNGVIEMLKHPKCPAIEKFYYNGAEQLFGKTNESNQYDHLTEIKLKAIAEECSAIGDKEEIGYSEGSSLSFLLTNKNISCNSVVDGRALYREICDSFYIGAMKFILIGPDENSIIALKNIWLDKLKDKKINPRMISKTYHDAFEKYVSSFNDDLIDRFNISETQHKTIEELANSKFINDDSVTNASSFSFLIEFNGKRILYLGDCNVNTVISWLDKTKQDKIKVDVVKISHHGSKKNTNLELLKRIESTKYLISTNGALHNHPDIETLARIALVNNISETEVLINYEIEDIPTWFISELNEKYPLINLKMNCCEIDL